MIFIDSQDYTDLEIDEPPFDFRFPETATSVIYQSVDTFSIKSIDSLNEFLPYSPFNAVLKGDTVGIVLNDNQNTTLSRAGIVTAVKNESGQFALTIEDNINALLAKNMVPSLYTNLTPAEILSKVAISFGLSVDLSSLSNTMAFQVFAGLSYDLEYLIGQESTVLDVFSDLCQAGFMRGTIYNSRVYVIPPIGFNPPFNALELMESEILSQIVQIDGAKDIYNGGTIAYSLGTFTSEISEAPDPAKRGGRLELAYGHNNYLKLINPSGALSLLQYYSDPLAISSHYECDLHRKISSQLTPGSYIYLPKGAVNPVDKTLCRVVGRERIPFNQHAERCILEVYSA